MREIQKLLLSRLSSQEYSRLIPGTVVGTLSDDSGNVIQLIEEAYAVRFPEDNKVNMQIDVR